MKKVLKYFALIAAIGAVIGMIMTLLCKSRTDEDLFSSDPEDEDFDLDSDLQAVEREYVPLKKSDSAETVKTNETLVKEEKDPSI